jgi:hypothetical protein
VQQWNRFRKNARPSGVLPENAAAGNGMPQTSGLGFEGRIRGFLAGRTPIAI